MTGNMKGIFLYKEREGLFLEDIPIPQPQSGEVLIQLKACGVCGTDVHLTEKHIPISLPKVIPGHEMAGVIKEKGSDVHSFSVGDRVLIFPQIFCGKCYACKSGSEELCVKPKIFGMDVNGGFAEYVCVPERVLLKAPAHLPFTETALFAESIGVAFHAIFARGKVQANEKVLVVGTGGLGTNAIKLLKPLVDSSGVQIIAMDTSSLALERAKKLGASWIIDAQKQDPQQIIQEITQGEGVDVALEFVGKAATVKTAYRALKKGGRLVLVGVGSEKVDFGPIIAMAANGKSVIPSFGYSRQSAQDLLRYVEKHSLSFADSVTQVFSLSQAQDAVQKLKSSSGECVRCVIEY